MTSKECLEKLSYIPIYEEDIDIIFKGDLCEVYRNEVDIISKDLDLLEEYRKIEKEIGVDFITLVKMLKDDVYINDGGIVNEIGHIYKEQVKSIEHWPVWGFAVGDSVEYAFKDRGKTWALDKEEFYENIRCQEISFDYGRMD